MKERAFEPIITDYKKGWKRLLSFMGPAYLISVGYMDPGNWATDLAAGSRYGYSLLWVIVLSTILPVWELLQEKTLHSSAVVIIPADLNFVYWIFAEIAIAATDLAEILGLAIGLNLLFGIDIIIGVIFSLFDTLIIMVLVKRGIRRMEAIIIAMISIIGLCFAVELFFARPDTGELVKGLIPSLPDNQAIYLAVGIIGATIMPHNLYLHSSLVQTRQINSDDEGKRSALRYNLIDTVIALGLALFVNASILILAAAVFHRTGNAGIEDITEAHKLLSPLLGTAAASVLFALALVASGQSSTLTGTLTGTDCNGGVP
ncbi:hypothetical protein CHS0354_030110 [Potamilus streckersoni]|uniref:Uncharacterized protein n=1 Tax=Potamilus streckersoni TaxID=2493646 RepID=A0AAE0RLT3_9BIVA|nr:hypothetical protein CHS0354_030110 [Potamilus streckersoni]